MLSHHKESEVRIGTEVSKLMRSTPAVGAYIAVGSIGLGESGSEKRAKNEETIEEVQCEIMGKFSAWIKQVLEQGGASAAQKLEFDDATREALKLVPQNLERWRLRNFFNRIAESAIELESVDSRRRMRGEKELRSAVELLEGKNTCGIQNFYALDTVLHKRTETPPILKADALLDMLGKRCEICNGIGLGDSVLSDFRLKKPGKTKTVDGTVLVLVECSDSAQHSIPVFLDRSEAPMWRLAAEVEKMEDFARKVPRPVPKLDYERYRWTEEAKMLTKRIAMIAQLMPQDYSLKFRGVCQYCLDERTLEIKDSSLLGLCSDCAAVPADQY